MSEKITSYSPIDGSILYNATVLDIAERNIKIKKAYWAFLEWRRVPAPMRGNFIRILGNLFRKDKEDIAWVITREVGKTYQEALGEVQEVIDICDFAVGLSRQLHGLTIASERPEHMLLEQWHPVGPVGVITAFNFPMAVWAWNAALALVCGNTVVWKPSELAPLCADSCMVMVEKAIKEAGVPEDLVTILHGGAEIGAEIVESDKIAMISATGSVKMGKAVSTLAAPALKRCLLELGGNNAAIVTPSANLDLAIRGLVFAAVGTTGQRCTTLRRLIVHESIANEVLERMVRAYKTLKIGSPLDKTVHIGPLINENAWNMMRITKQCLEIDEGRKVYGGLAVIDNVPDGGFYTEPAIVVHEDRHSDFIKEEVFAPMLHFLKYSDLEEAIELHNDVPQGLSSSIFTQDISEALYFCGPNGSDCGIANVNIGTSGAEIGGAFGGEKDTGGGRESGSDCWKNYMRRATNTLNFSKELPLAQGIKFDI